jgi:hypothetical protein
VHAGSFQPVCGVLLSTAFSFPAAGDGINMKRFQRVIWSLATTWRAEHIMIVPPMTDNKDGVTPKNRPSSTAAKNASTYSPVEPRDAVSRCSPIVKRVWGITNHQWAGSSHCRTHLRHETKETNHKQKKCPTP